MTRKISAEDLRAIAEGRLMLNVRNGVTVSRSMLAKVADDIDALSSATPAEEDPHEVIHVYEGDGGIIIRENGNVSTFGVQSPEVMSAFHAATATPADVVGLWTPVGSEHAELGWLYDFDQIERISKAARDRSTGGRAMSVYILAAVITSVVAWRHPEAPRGCTPCRAADSLLLGAIWPISLLSLAFLDFKEASHAPREYIISDEKKAELDNQAAISEAISTLTAAGYVILPAAEVEARERAARDKALEEAAKVADDPWAVTPSEHATGEQLCHGIATAIRALKGEKP